MTIKIQQRFLLLLFLALAFSACKKDKTGTPPQGNARMVKYSITGNFTGKFTVVYSDNINGITTLNDVILPWAKEINYAPAVLSVGISAQASVAGAPGQTATIAINSAGTAVQSSTKTAGSLGELAFPSLGHTF